MKLSGLVCTIVFLLAAFSAPSRAAPQVYSFDYAASKIEFTYTFSGDKISGEFPDFSGDLLVDFKDIRNSKVAVEIQTGTSKGGFVFATSALRGPKILDSKVFPKISFVSTSSSLDGSKAVVNGNVTVRGVTKPMQLLAKFYHLEGPNPQDRSELVMVITGKLNRHDFGASGYRDMVGEVLDITITAKILRQDD